MAVALLASAHQKTFQHQRRHLLMVPNGENSDRKQVQGGGGGISPGDNFAGDNFARGKFRHP